MPYLTNLSLRDAAFLDETALLMEKWYTPALIHLDLRQTSIADPGLEGWVTRTNMPNLTTLLLGSCWVIQTKLWWVMWVFVT